jgi:defect-in-organelle-trafficking protein DotC
MPRFNFYLIWVLLTAHYSDYVYSQNNYDQLLSSERILLVDEQDIKAKQERRRFLAHALKQASDDNASDGSSLRLQSLANIAYDWGLNEGLYFYHSRHQASLNERAILLNNIADFSPFIINGKLLLPSVSKTQRSYEQVSDFEARSFSVSYTLVKPAKIVKSPPSWRDYLLRPLHAPEKPNALLFPRNSKEKHVFEYEFTRGWQQGKVQSELILEQDYAKLERDLAQHWNFRELALQNIVRLPTLHTSNDASAISRDGRTLNVNDVIYRIDTQSQWKSLEEWQPIFKDH